MERMSVVQERSEYLVLGVERSYKSQEETIEAPRKVMEPELGRKSLPSNQPMERTLSRCALQRRSSARWVAVKVVEV